MKLIELSIITLLFCAVVTLSYANHEKTLNLNMQKPFTMDQKTAKLAQLMQEEKKKQQQLQQQQIQKLLDQIPAS
ncbi:MAG: hypothetical protein ACQESH_02180, partial [Campylobacterota bacterium]